MYLQPPSVSPLEEIAGHPQRSTESGLVQVDKHFALEPADAAEQGQGRALVLARVLGGQVLQYPQQALGEGALMPVALPGGSPVFVSGHG
ncbi:hypothetical protein [Streptomyces sp. NPDC002215]|uniref:hypothetical protein n=1 Tax=Streptomyces sp. NPDC002215 TaxID=3154412 RepID=UPI00331F816D